MNNKDTFEFIIEVEKKLKKTNLQYERYFLVLRLFLYGELRAKKKVNKITFFQIIRNILKDIFCLFRLKRLFSKENVVFVPDEHYNLYVDEILISKHVEALKSEVGEVGEVSLGRNSRTKFSFTSIMALIYKLSLIKLNSKSIEMFVHDLKYICDDVSKYKGLNFDVNTFYLLELIYKLEFYIFFYEKIIPKNKNLKKCFFIAYYNIHSLALIEVFKKRGVSCIDYQHGVQNNFHPMYVSLSIASKSIGLPSSFWGWDDISKKRIVSALGESFFREVGNLWYKTKFYKKSIIPVLSTKKKILVALQAWPDFFNFNLFDVIEKDENYLWVFREHPLNMLPDFEKEQIKNKYINVCFENLATNSVEMSIASCEMCITGFSTVGIEAYHMGKKVVFTHENAILGLSDYIDGVDVFYASDYEDILEKIHSII